MGRPASSSGSPEPGQHPTKVGWLRCGPLAAAVLHWVDTDYFPSCSDFPTARSSHTLTSAGNQGRGLLGNQEILAYSSRVGFQSSASLSVSKAIDGSCRTHRPGAYEIGLLVSMLWPSVSEQRVQELPESKEPT